MIKELVERVPLATKVEYALRMIGLDEAERSSIDAVIGAYGGNPIVATVLGEEVRDLKAGIASVYKLTTEHSEQAESGKAIGRALIASPQARQVAAKAIVKWIEAQPDAANLMSALQKASDLPLPGFAGTHYPDAATFIADGALPFIGTFLGKTDSEEMGLPCKCPYCSKAFIHLVT